MNKTVSMSVLVLVVVVIAAVFLYQSSILSKLVTGTSAPSVPIALTDPAEVPANTSSLYISYSSFRVTFLAANSSSGTAVVNSSGSIDLLSLVNVSKVLALASLPASSSVKTVQFTVVSANATINGTTYNVSVPSPVVTAVVPLKFNRINSSSSIMLDFTPALITVYTASSTKYVLVPSLLALSTTGVSRHIGAVSHLPANVNRTLFSARPNITIISATLQQIGNLTKISVTVKDNSNQSVMLQHLRLKMANGFKFSALNFSQNVFNNTRKDLRKYILNASSVVSDIGSHLPSFINGLNRSIYYNLSSINSSVAGGIGSISNVVKGRLTRLFNISRSFSNFGNVGLAIHGQFANAQNQMKQNLLANENRINIMNRILAGVSINFFVSSNGTLFLPFSGFKLFRLPLNVSTARVNRINSTNMNVSYNQSGLSSEIANKSSFSLPVNFGYSLSAGSSVTLNFSGEMNLGDGLVSLELVSGTQYSLYLQGTYGASAAYTVNATS